MKNPRAVRVGSPGRDKAPYIALAGSSVSLPLRLSPEWGPRVTGTECCLSVRALSQPVAAPRRQPERLAAPKSRPRSSAPHGVRRQRSNEGAAPGERAALLAGARTSPSGVASLRGDGSHAARQGGECAASARFPCSAPTSASVRRAARYANNGPRATGSLSATSITRSRDGCAADRPGGESAQASLALLFTRDALLNDSYQEIHHVTGPRLCGRLEPDLVSDRVAQLE